MALCLGTLTAGTLWSMHGGAMTAMEGLKPPFGGRKRVNVLVLGLDDGQGGLSRSDTMMLVHVDTVARRLAVLSIPRDTRVPLGEGHYAKINSAHARGGPGLAARAVTSLTGLPVAYTLTTDFAGFRRLVDLIGGIDLAIEQAMDYDDQWGNLHIHLQPGRQHLDGAKAIEYVRYRKGNGGRSSGDGSDLSRIGRQQKFLAAVAARCMAGENLARLPEILREGRSQLRTDLTPSDLLYLGGLAKEIGAGRVKVLTIPGKTAMIGGQSYWLPAERELAGVVRELDGTAAARAGAV